jgi:hypothetical protein
MSDAFPTANLAAMVDAYYSAITNPEVILNVNPTPPNPLTMTIQDIVEPTDADWYHRIPATVNEAYLNSLGQLQVDVDSVQWNYVGSGASETIYSFALVGTTGASIIELVSQGVFSPPVVMAQSLNACTARPSVVFPQVSLS